MTVKPADLDPERRQGQTQDEYGPLKMIDLNQFKTDTPYVLY